jgi:predicted regulator of Ras-like GTPase activity (Roadblock/LC7/MglB family)
MLHALGTLRDVEGVVGSFVVDSQGGVLARDMPNVVDEHALSGAARRVARLRAALETGGRKAEQCSLRFGSYLLVARPEGRVVLCVLVSGAANLMSLHMGATLVARRLASEVADVTPKPRASLPPPSLPPPPPLPPLLPEPASPTRIFRGRPV